MKKNGSKIRVRRLKGTQKKKIRIFKLDRATRIFNFFYTTETSSKIDVILPSHSAKVNPYGLSPDKSIQYKIFFKPPYNYDDMAAISQYLQDSKHAILNGQIHIFGGIDPQQVTRKFKGKISNIFISDWPIRWM